MSLIRLILRVVSVELNLLTNFRLMREKLELLQVDKGWELQDDLLRISTEFLALPPSAVCAWVQQFGNREVWVFP